MLGWPASLVRVAQPAIAELITRFGCGVTVAPGDGRLMGSLIERMMRAPDELTSMGQRARTMLVENYAKSRAMANWETLLSELPSANLSQRAH